MKHSLRITVLSGLFLVLFAGAAFAAEGEAAGGNTWVLVAAYAAAGIGIALASIGGAAGQSKAIAAGLKGIARNPGAAGKLTTTLIIGLAMIESLVIYALVISLLLVFKK